MKFFLATLVAFTLLLTACNLSDTSAQGIDIASKSESVSQPVEPLHPASAVPSQALKEDNLQPEKSLPDWDGFKLCVVTRDGKPVPNLRIYFAEQVQNMENPHKTNDQYLGLTNEAGEYIYQQTTAGSKSYFIANSEVEGEFASGKKYLIQMEEDKRAEPITVVWEDSSPRETAMALENKVVLAFNDADGNPVPGIHLEISIYAKPDANGTSVDTGWSTKAYTEADGSFVLANPAKASYSIVASYPDPAIVGGNNSTFYEYSFEISESGTTEKQFTFAIE